MQRKIRQAVEIDGSAFRQTLMEVAGKKLGSACGKRLLTATLRFRRNGRGLCGGPSGGEPASGHRCAPSSAPSPS